MAEVQQQPIVSQHTAPQPAAQQLVPQSAGFQITTHHITVAVFCVVLAIVTFYAYDHFVKNQGGTAVETDGAAAAGKKDSNQEVAGFNLHDTLRRISDKQRQITSQLSSTMN